MEAAAKQTFTFPGAIPPKTIVRSTPRAKRMVFGGKELSRSKEMEADIYFSKKTKDIGCYLCP